MRKGAKRGFTLIEALVSVALVSVGIVTALNCLTAMGRARQKSFDRTTMQRLAYRKFDELIVENTIDGGKMEGNFDSINEPRFTWKADINTTGTEGLEVLRVVISPRGNEKGASYETQGLVCKIKEKSQ